MFLFMLICLNIFSPVATDVTTEINESIGRLELFFEYHDSHPQFKEFVKNKYNCSHEETLYLNLLLPPVKLSIAEKWSKINDPSQLVRTLNRFRLQK